jgi:putative CRISPR-associated protein (TIGR02619 family)
MNRIVVSTIGTSLLTNQINKKATDEDNWYPKLRDTAQLSLDETPQDVQEIIKTLGSRATEKLTQSKNIGVIRSASAELNGIYGLYAEDLTRGVLDIHWLVATDTAQGFATANIVQNFLQKNGLNNTNIQTPSGLSTASTEAFASGVDDLRDWINREIEPLRDQYRVYFNLVGGFKSLQGYLNTMGMFYADEIIYIFEGKDSNLITIPRLPIKIDTEQLEPHKVKLALMDTDFGISAEAAQDVPEALVFDLGNKKILSTWGKLIWDGCKVQLLSQELVQLPHIQYNDTFRADYNKIGNSKDRFNLQQELIKVSATLQASNGDTSILLSSFRYTRYQNSDQIDHFRISQSMRVSCKSVNGNLILRYYGTHNHVERSEGL